MTGTKVLQVNNVDIYVIKKDIKNIHLAVYPPDANNSISKFLSLILSCHHTMNFVSSMR